MVNSMFAIADGASSRRRFGVDLSGSARNTPRRAFWQPCVPWRTSRGQKGLLAWALDQLFPLKNSANFLKGSANVVFGKSNLP